MVIKMDDRIKVDLLAMSERILTHLRQCDPQALPYTPEMLNLIAVQFNKGALLQYQYGEIDKAETLCLGAIELFSELSSHATTRALCLANMIPPYINLGRIYGQKGEVKESLNIFYDIYQFSLQQQDLSICGHRISSTDGPAIFETAMNLQKVMLSCQVIEAARVLQTFENYPALLALVETNKILPEYQDAFYSQYLLEVRSRALLGMGQHEMAMEALVDCFQHMALNTTDRIAIHPLISQIYRQWGRADMARITLDKMEDCLVTMGTLSRIPISRQLTYRLALERYALRDGLKALEPAEKAFKLCSRWNDHPGMIKCAILLLRICIDGAMGTCSSAMRRHWYGVLQELASTTSFRIERAIAYWELGLSSEFAEFDSGDGTKHACEYLKNSYLLYRSIPFVDSMQSCAEVKRSLDLRVPVDSARSTPASETIKPNASSIDEVFAALMTYVPHRLTAITGDVYIPSRK